MEAVLQQEADLRKVQQQFRVEMEQSKPQEQGKLAPWEVAEQRRLLPEQPVRSKQKLAPWEVAEQRRIQSELPVRSERKLAPWEVAEQRRLQQEQQPIRQEQSNQRKLEPWEIAEQRRIQQEQALFQAESKQRNLAPWEIAEQRRIQQEAELHFQDDDFDYVLDRNIIQEPFADYIVDTSFPRGQQENSLPQVVHILVDTPTLT